MKRYWLYGILGLLLCLFFCQILAEAIRVPSCALVLKSGTSYNEEIAAGFKQFMEQSGAKWRIATSESAGPDSQAGIINNLIREGTDFIVISADQEYATASALKAAVNKKIVVITIDSDTEAGSRSLYISPVSSQEMGAQLVRSAYDAGGGQGQWAVLAGKGPITGQEEWIGSMKRTLENPRYQKMRLVDIVCGEDDYSSSVKKVRELIWSHPDLRVISSATAAGSRAARDVIAGYKMEDEIKVAGVGILDREAAGSSCGWDPYELGEAAACVCNQLYSGEAELEAGQIFKAEEGKRWEISSGGDGGLTIAAGRLYHRVLPEKTEK